MSRQVGTKCILCGREVAHQTSGYVLCGAQFHHAFQKKSYYAPQRAPEERIYFDMSANKKFPIHTGCMSKIIWEREHPDMILEQVYYDNLLLSVNKGKRVWRIDREIVPEDVTKNQLDIFLSKIAKKLLVGEGK